jgi:hypothetical protein
MFVEGNGSWVVLFLEVSFRRLRDHPWFALSCYNFFLPVDKDTPWIIDSFKKLNMDFMLLSRRLEFNNLKAMS